MVPRSTAESRSPRLRLRDQFLLSRRPTALRGDLRRPELLRPSRAKHRRSAQGGPRYDYTTQTNGTVTVTFYASGAVHWSFGDSSKPFVGAKAKVSAAARPPRRRPPRAARSSTSLRPGVATTPGSAAATCPRAVSQSHWQRPRLRGTGLAACGPAPVASWACYGPHFLRLVTYRLAPHDIRFLPAAVTPQGL